MMEIKSNLDKVSAEIGFYACDIYSSLCAILGEEIKNFKNYNELKADKEFIITKIKERAKIKDNNFNGLIKSILNEIIFKTIENSKDREKSFRNLKEKPPKFDANELEKVITKALGILIEDGLFAYAIWLESENKDPHKVIMVSSLELLKSLELVVDTRNNLRGAILNDISPYIERTLLARQVLERMLTYARYRAKSLQKGR